MHDVIIIGAGPAGLSAALVLGRCRRRVLVCDSGKPRNWASRGIHGFVTRDGLPPGDFRRIAREELRQYTSVEVRDAEAVDAAFLNPGFEIALAGGERLRSRTLLLATGRIDLLPEVENARTFFGRGLYTCPYCDGWEHRDEPLGVLGSDNRSAGMALELLDWSRDVLLFAHGEPRCSPAYLQKLTRHGVRIVSEPIARLEGGETLTGVRLESGEEIARTALFFYSDQFQRSALPEQLGCLFDGEGAVTCDGHAATCVPGLYVAGNVRCGIQLAIVAAGEGTEAAFAIHNRLQDEDYA